MPPPRQRLAAAARELLTAAGALNSEAIEVIVRADGVQLTYQLTAAPAPDIPADTLPDIEADILEALGQGCLAARQIAEKAGYQLNSHFRGVLARMRKAGRLRHDGTGYRRGIHATAD